MMINQANAADVAAYIRDTDKPRSIPFFPKIQEQMTFAYQDVLSSFEYYLEHFNNDRPFILASHSQGTAHAVRLLQERIDGTGLAKRLVAAYLIGFRVPRTTFENLKDIDICDTPNQLHCAVHWDAMGIDAAPRTNKKTTSNAALCVNPLTWRR